MAKTSFPLVVLLAAAVAAPIAQAAPMERELAWRSVTVNGSCQKELTPDLASLNMVAMATNPKDLKAAANEAVKIYESARARIAALKLKDAEFTTSEYNVQPVYDWANNKQTLRGYQARIGLRVSSTEVERMGEVMAQATEAKMVDVGMWQLQVSPAKFKDAQKSCLASAVVDARNNAERMAQAAGAKLGNVLTMTQEGSAPPPVMPMYKTMRAEMIAGDAAQAPGIESGKQDVTVTVQASFSLE
jgi:uncharacterized protein YggE